MELTAAGQGSDEAKRLGGQCPLLLKPRGGSDSGLRGSAVGKYARGCKQVRPRDAARVQMLIE